MEPPPSGSIQDGLVPPHIKGLVPPDIYCCSCGTINSDVDHPTQHGPREPPVPPHSIPLREYIEADAPVHAQGVAVEGHSFPLLRPDDVPPRIKAPPLEIVRPHL